MQQYETKYASMQHDVVLDDKNCLQRMASQETVQPPAMPYHSMNSRPSNRGLKVRAMYIVNKTFHT